tara:strand:+ start:104 stop:316 length:213 start_codon:yes stop_codon:yes gene_type:complete
MEDTYNITIKCNSEDERDAVLQIIDSGELPWRVDETNLVYLEIVRHHENSNVFFNEDYGMKPSTPLRKVT